LSQRDTQKTDNDNGCADLTDLVDDAQAIVQVIRLSCSFESRGA